MGWIRLIHPLHRLSSPGKRGRADRVLGLYPRDSCGEADDGAISCHVVGRGRARTF